MGEHWIDKKGREVGRCTYCLCAGHARNLFKLPRKYCDGESDLGREYCPKCYPDVLEATKKQPWNKNK